MLTDMNGRLHSTHKLCGGCLKADSVISFIRFDSLLFLWVFYHKKGEKREIHLNSSLEQKGDIVHLKPFDCS